MRERSTGTVMMIPELLFNCIDTAGLCITVCNGGALLQFSLTGKLVDFQFQSCIVGRGLCRQNISRPPLRQQCLQRKT